MLNDDEFKIIEDDLSNETNASPSNSIYQNFSSRNSKKNSDKLNNTIEKNKQNSSATSNNNATQNKNTNLNSGIDNGNQFRKSGNLANISKGLSSDDPDEQQDSLKGLGKEAIKPLVRKGVQTATGGMVGTDPVTRKVIDKTVDKVADNPNIDKIINDVTAKVKKVKSLSKISKYLPIIGIGVGIFMIILLISFLFTPVFANDDEKQNKYEKKYYDEMERVSSLYNNTCEGSFNEILIGTSIFYDQMVYNDGFDIEYLDEEDMDVTTSFNSKINYKHKDGNILTLAQQLYPNFNFSADADNSSSSACTSSYYGYKSYLKSYVDSNYKNIPNGVDTNTIVDEILAIGGYSVSSGSSVCSSSCEYNIDGQSVSNIMVRLLDNSGNPIEGQELISFEKYILGVVYGEIGSSVSAEEAKTQAIAARSFALSRPSVMNGAGGVKLVEEDGQWILYLRNSTNDQVYCDPDLGCSQRSDSVFVSGANNAAADPNAEYYPKNGLDGNAPLRSYVSSVAGVVALDANGEILVTSYTNTQQIDWKNSADAGKNYTEILRSTYPNLVELSDGNCASLCSHASGDFTKWKQTDSQWSNIALRGGLTIGDSGCLITSVAIQVARSGVETPLGSDFNPGTLVENYRNSLFTSDGNFYWNSITSIIPNFVQNTIYNGSGMSSMSDSAQIAFLTNGINNGCYYVVEVKSWKSGQHWVAIDTIENDIIYMMDPASNSVDLNATVAKTGYNYRINKAVCYQIK